MTQRGVHTYRSFCPTCEIETFTRNHYFTGKLLVERDFTDEQRYYRDKLRHHHQRLHGCGVVCGLKVKEHPDPACRDRFVCIEPGTAVDCCGREIMVREEECIDITQTEAIRDLKKRMEKEKDDPDCQTSHALQICLRYRECHTEDIPVLYDECGCDDTQCAPNRILESYAIDIIVNPKEPDWIHRVRTACEVADCETLYKTMLEPCPDPTVLDCIPLAVIRNYTPGQPVTETMIDNWSHRPLLPSTHLLDLLIRCILAKRALTHIRDIGWDHGAEYSCHQFMRSFVGDDQSPKAFEVTFERPVLTTEELRKEEPSPRIFQAIVVRDVDKPSEGRSIEVAPARAWQSDDRTRVFLRIDPSYALALEREQVTFDLYLTLRCNMIVDERGVPVDGDLLAQRHVDGTYHGRPPTGDGVPGGTFESWIRVRH